MVRYSVNYQMSFGVDVTQKEIDTKRKCLEIDKNKDMIWNLTIDKNSSDEEIANFIGIEKYREAEAVEMELEGTETYDQKREKELELQDEERKKQHE